MSDDSNVKVVYLRAELPRVEAWEARARSIDRPLSWWIREVLDWAVRTEIGDPRQLDLPFDAPPSRIQGDALAEHDATRDAKRASAAFAKTLRAGQAAVVREARSGASKRAKKKGKGK